jgi:hypothetical protein
MNDLLFTQGKDNLAGLVDKIAIIASEDILTLPDLAAITSIKTEAATDIVFKEGKKMAQVYITDETGKIDIKSVGERDGKGRESMLTGRHPALGIELEDFIRQCQNTPSVVAFRLARNGKIYLMGVSQLDQTSVVLSLAIPCYFETGDSSSGEKRPDQNGSLLGWKFTAGHGPIEYVGTWANLFVAGPA